MWSIAAILLFATVAPSGAASLRLDELLAQVGSSVETFQRQFTSVSCTEIVSQSKFGKSGAVAYKQDSIFDYLVFIGMQSETLVVEESRQKRDTPGKTKSLPLLVTDGFPTLLLVFHPYYQGSFAYQQLEDDLAEGKRMLRVHFQHLSGERTTSALRLRGRDYPLELQGTAWIDPESKRITRIAAALKAPMEDVGLRTFTTDVRYSPVLFSAAAPPYWLPATATIDVETARQHWRNVHRFTEYKRFTVDSESSVQSGSK
jgi:hypothetical protein